MNQAEHIPPDQFERVLREMRKLDMLVGEVQEHIEVARGVTNFEAQRALNEVSRHIEIAQYFMGKAIAESMKKGGQGNGK